VVRDCQILDNIPHEQKTNDTKHLWFVYDVQRFMKQTLPTVVNRSDWQIVRKPPLTGPYFSTLIEKAERNRPT
jgi:hypothetical protein